jgi:hypothetical protein
MCIALDDDMNLKENAMNKTIVPITSLLMICLFAGIASALPYPALDPAIPQITLNGNQYSDARVQSNIRPWFDMGDGSIMSPWQTAWVEYTVNLSVASLWDIGLNAINYGNLGTDWYDTFELEALLMDGKGNVVKNTMLHITASDTEENYDYFSYGTGAANTGIYTVRYTWLNDERKAALGLDANIGVTSAFFYDPVPVPEPSTILLLGIGVLGGVCLRRKK